MAAEHDGIAHAAEPALVKAALQLKTQGYAVIESVISQEECERSVDRCWGWLESLGTGAPCLSSAWLARRHGLRRVESKWVQRVRPESGQ